MMGFFEDLAQPFTGEMLFDLMPDTVFFVKDQQGRYVSVNETLVRRCPARSKADVLGRSAAEVFGLKLGNDYEVQDRRVIESGEPLLNKLELHLFGPGHLGWCLTYKLPVRDKQGTVVGLVGISRDLKSPDLDSGELAQVADVVTLAEDNVAQPPSVSRLAKTAGMSIYQLDRRMKRIFGLTTGQWLLKLRIEHANSLLLNTDLPVTDVALEVGYQSHTTFARQFKRTTGITPTEFRARGHGRR